MADQILSCKIIKCIEKYTVLYDPQYEKLKVRQEYWNKAAEELDLNVDLLKSKWKNLRDGYIKFLQCEANSKQQARNVSHFRLSKEIDFLKPYLRIVLPPNVKDILEDTSFVNLWARIQKLSEDMQKTTMAKMWKIVSQAEEKVKPTKKSKEWFGEDSDSSDVEIRVKVKSLCTKT